MQHLPLRLAPGADLRRALEDAARALPTASAFVLAGIGSLVDARLRLAGASEETVVAGPIEILSVSGTLGAAGAHLHMAVSDAQGRVHGGHVVYGNVVRTTAEILLAPLAGWTLSRAHDPATGFQELVVQRAQGQGAATTPPALLVIDMQRGMASPAAGVRNNPGAESAILGLLQAWRGAGAPVVHVRHISTTPGSPFWPGQPGVEFQPALAPQAGEHVVEKNVPDAFAHTGLARWLHERGIARLVIVGVSTNNSVEATARAAGNLGFQVRVAADATFAFAKVDFDGVARSAQEVHAMALANLHGEYATVTLAAELHPT